MIVPISDELQRFVDESVASGDYATSEDVVAAALRLLAEQRAAWLTDARAKVAVGLEQARAGDMVDGEEAFRRARERLADRHGKTRDAG